MLGNKNKFRVRVSVYERIEDGSVLYDGEFLKNSDTECDGGGLLELSEKVVDPGFFESIFDLAGAVRKGVEDVMRNFEPQDKSDTAVHFFNEIDETYGDAYFDFSGSYIQRRLNDQELRQILFSTDSRLRKEICGE